MALVKNPVATLSDVEKSFSDLLTPYAFEYVKKQLSLKSKVVCEKETDAGFIVLSHEGMRFKFMHTRLLIFYLHTIIYIGTLDVTCNACPCKFATTLQLPCRHMLAVRERKDIPLYREDGIAKRWKILYMQQVFDDKHGDDTIMTSDSYKVK